MDLDILSWNCRGICSDSTTRALKDLISQNRPQVVFLCETKISKEVVFERLRRALGFANAEAVLSNGRSGGLGLFWNDEVKLQIGTKSAHHIDAVVLGGANLPDWRLTGFYGYANTGERDKSWKLLRDLADLDSRPWIIIGDFNEILNKGEKIDGPARPERQMRGFRAALGYGELLDLGYHGVMATWGNSDTLLRLDRAVCTPSWFDIFNHAKLFHLPPSDSDHVPLLLKASTTPLGIRPKIHRFHFEAYWLRHEDCDGVVKEAWEAEVSGSPMFVVTQKIRNTSLKLNNWQKAVFRGRQIKMLAIRNRMEELMGLSITDAGQEEKRGLFDRLQALLNQEELFWKQRAKVLWLQEGDRNTSFFHKKAASRRRKNSLKGLFDADGNWREDDKGLEEVVTDYFSKMFQSTALDYDAVHSTLEAITPCVTREMNDQLLKAYSSEEIKCALFQMFPTKSPGPDGMPPLFFQHYWELIGPEVVAAVQNFFLTGRILKQINYTHICLIPKVENPEQMSDLRPIALCNVVYKICSKAMANRLKVILPTVISPFQSAFVPGRLITDNILVANEVAHFVHNKREGRKGYMALKLDLSKAYDRLEWSFLEKVMQRFGFHSNWIQLVMQCVTTVRYSFIVRGKARGSLTPSRGLRQGDPLSPYLFLLGAEGFSALMHKKLIQGSLPGIAVCNQAPHVNHLLFADDSMLYAEASFDACAAIQEVIDTYSRASGQLVNATKSSIVFSKNVDVELQASLAGNLGMEIVESHERYLGLPTYVGRKKSESFQFIKDRLEVKLAAWQGKCLSGAGKDILIRVVAQALPTYAMSVFKLTQNFCDDLEQMCARFWWGSTLDQKKIHWKRWDVLCNPREAGGLGFRSLSHFNTAMLTKQAWRVLADPTSLIARIYKARYFPDCSFWDASDHYSPSFSWRSIFGTRDILRENVHWQVGNGHDISIFSDKWIPGAVSGSPTCLHSSVEEVTLVSDLMLHTGRWDEGKVARVFSPSDAELILRIPLSRRQVPDRLCWKLALDGKFSVKTTFRYVFLHSSNFSPLDHIAGAKFWKILWKTCIPNKAKLHAWRICIDILPSLGSLETKRVEIDSNLCVLCGLAAETTLHLSRDCEYTKSVLQVNPALNNLCFRWGEIHESVMDWLYECSLDMSLEFFGELLFSLWSIWKERNARIWDQKSLAAIDVSTGIAARLHDFRGHNLLRQRLPKGNICARWQAPPPGVWKINVDGAYNHVTKHGGWGFVIRDHKGSMHAGGAGPLHGLISAEHAELVACCKAFEFASEQGFNLVMLETDAQMVQRQLEDADMPNTSLLGRIYEDLWMKIKEQGNWSVKYRNRRGNTAAHTLAAYACSLEQDEFYFATPSVIEAVIAAELCNS